MDKDRIEGSAKDMKGKAKESIGKLTGDRKTEMDGTADRAEGKTQNTIGGIKDSLRGK
ncbi:CsbD family protein [Salinarimonas sp.]|uniref:CsbD family protein n=1 Tax=Salinarimonas sp. TaxID=2766526 RepID=UPI00391CC9F2